MSRQRESEEERILTYFRTASFDKVELMFGLVRREVRERQPVRKQLVRKSSKKSPEVTPGEGGVSAT